MGKTTAVRTVPTGTTEPVGTLAFDDDVENQSAVKYEEYSPHGYPLILAKIATAVTTLNRLYPYDGTGTFPGITDTTHVQLDTTASTIPADCTNLLLHIISGTAGNIGATRRITLHGASAQMTLNRALPATPAIGDGYLLLIDLFRFSQFVIRGESSASGSPIGLAPVFYDYAHNHLASGFRAARPAVGALDSLEQIGPVNVPPCLESSAYFNNRLGVYDARGALGGKVLLTSIGSGSVSLWAGAT
jgi:hypothetical protein